VSSDGGTVIVDWLDAHCSQFSAEWLHARRFEEDAQAKWLAKYKQEKQVWKSTQEENFPSKKYIIKTIKI